jgi:hypothetical protein
MTFLLLFLVLRKRISLGEEINQQQDTALMLCLSSSGAIS